MKKLLLLAAAGFLAAATTKATTVTIDWSTDQIIKPTEVYSSTSSGSTVNYHLVLKNLGPDSAIAGDTVLYQVALTYTNNNPIVVAPSSSSFYFKVLTKTIKSGDTMHVVGAFTFALYPYPSVNVNFIAISHVVNRARGLNFETSFTNNSKTTTIVWYNPQGWPVSTSTPTVSSISIFPTVVSNSFIVNLKAISVNSPVVVRIMDMMGRVVFEQNFAEAKPQFTVNTQDLSNGTYVVKVQNGISQYTEKIIVQK